MPLSNSKAARQRQIANLADRPPRPEHGNQRAVKAGHLGHGEELAVRREAHARSLRQDYPDLDDRRLALLADKLARSDLGSAWLDRQGGVVRNRRGDVYDVADRVDRWENRVWAMLGEVEREQREAAVRVDLAVVLSESDPELRRELLRQSGLLVDGDGD